MVSTQCIIQLHTGSKLDIQNTQIPKPNTDRLAYGKMQNTGVGAGYEDLSIGQSLTLAG